MEHQTVGDGWVFSTKGRETPTPNQQRPVSVQYCFGLKDTGENRNMLYQSNHFRFPFSMQWVFIMILMEKKRNGYVNMPIQFEFPSMSQARYT